MPQRVASPPQRTALGPPSNITIIPRRNIGGLQVRALGPPDARLEAQARAWLEHGPGHGVVVIKPGRVWRHGELAIKVFPAEHLVALGLRRSRARRSAEMHASLAPLSTPRPRLVLEGNGGRSLLVSEFIKGQFLNVIWKDNGSGVQAFPHFMAEMHRRGRLHGDFHESNALWTGREWVLLDLDGIRGHLHSLRRFSLIVRHWGRIHMALLGASGLKHSFATYLDAAKLTWDLERSWTKVVACSAGMARQRGIDPAYAQRDGRDPTL